MKFSPTQFLKISFLVLIILISAYLIAFVQLIGKPVKAEWWIADMYKYKDYVASSLESPKIIIIGGSNALFGIDSRIIEKITGFKTVNLSGHGGLDINYFYYKIKQHMKMGDIIIMPLEFPHYTQDKTTDWFARNMMAWGYKDYISKLPIIDLMKFISSVPKEIIYNGLFQSNQNTKLLTEEEVIKQLNSLLSSEGTMWRNYSFKSLNRYGDINVDKTPTEDLLKRYKKGIPYFNNEERISDHFISVYNDIHNLVKEEEGKFILTWPVTIKNKLFDLSKPEYQKKINELWNRLEYNSVDIYCNPALFNLNIKFFFNTAYHPNKLGAAIRSENLAGCINEVIKNGNHHDMRFDEAVAKTIKQETEKSREIQ